MTDKIVFSGIQPSGNLHIGNYIGSLRQWVKGQKDGLNIFCIVDMHAITVPQDPKTLREKTFELTAIYLAAGIDPEKSLIFVQSHNPDHANLGWILNNFTSMGQLSRMTQYKDKSTRKDLPAGEAGFVSVGLFDYPVLMAADIFLYNTTEVPVGDDQKQHVELARDIAEKFNTKFGDTFVLPKPVIPAAGGRIMSLVDPTKKMSKSDSNPNATIYLLDDLEVARKKIMSATTDSEKEIKYDWATKPGISNLIEIYNQLSDKSVKDIEKEFAGKSYKEFKEQVAEIVVTFLNDFQTKYNKIIDSDLKKILEDGATKSYKLSHPKLLEVYQKVGFLNG
jgi:tryptophanyl-tRNA synthetase